jgi:peptidoglycan/xylan/chitin deacetylase (PgdA/CDA1 family)
LDVLDAHDVKATFFLLGENIEKDMDAVRRIHADGHVIGSHTFTHAHMCDLTDDAIRSELERTSDAIHYAIGRRPLFFRLPYGESDARVLGLLGEYIVTQWNVDSLDWSNNDAATIDSIITNAVAEKQGWISLMHDFVGASASVLDHLIGLIKSKGFKLVTIDECLDSGRRYRDD